MSSGNARTLIYNLLAIVAVLAVLAFIFFRQGNETDGTAQSLDLICSEAATGDPVQAEKWIETFDTKNLDALSLAKLSLACMQAGDRGGSEALTARAVNLYNNALKADRTKALEFYHTPPAGQEYLVDMLITLANNLANPVDVSIERDIDPETHTTPAVQQ